MSPVVIVDVQNETSAPTAPGDARVRDCVEEAVCAVRGSDDTTLEFSVRFVDEQEGRLLNRKYGERDAATNVLSFPTDRLDGMPTGEPELLGDIVICGSVVEREAEEQGKDADGHWEHMLVHGTLHLLGFDHQDEHEAEAMEALETAILEARGFDDPYPGGTA